MKWSLVANLCDFEMDEKNFIQRINEHNPINNLAAMAKAKVSIFSVHGDSDKTVPLKENSEVVRDRYKKLGGKIDLKITTGAGHQVRDAFFKSKNLIEFLIKHS